MLRALLPDATAIIALIGLALGFFWKIAFTDLILPRGDVFTYFYPYWEYRNAVLRAGQIPFWNPYLFMGVPFLANSQTGVLYPPNWLLIPFDAATAIKAAIVLHISWAAIGAYLFARRSLNLSILGSTLAGAVFALGGYLTAQVEHINQLQGLSWLPWLFWLWEETLSGNRRVIVWLSVAFSMQLLAGHTQTAFITGVGLGLWALWHTLGLWRTRRVWRRERSYATLFIPVGVLALAALVAAGLSMAQLLPTLELTALSNRSGGLLAEDAVSFSFHPPVLGRGLLPSYSDVPLFTEFVAYPGVAALILAMLGVWLLRGEWKVIGLALLAGGGVFLALGAYNPLYWMLVRFVPGFDLFRAPARWLVLWAFATAALAGRGLDELGRSRAAWHRLVVSASLILLLATLSFAAVLMPDPLLGITPPAPFEVIIWLIVLAAALVLIVSLHSKQPRLRDTAPAMLAALVVVELFGASQGLPYNHLTAPTALTAQRPAISTLLAEMDGQTPPARILSLSDIQFDPGDAREIKAIYGRLLAPNPLYDFIIATKHKEIVAPNLPLYWRIPSMDGFDGGILPTRDFIRFSALFLDEEEVTPDGRLRENLHYIPDPFWLGISNVRYVITDKVYDAWINSAYYDLQFSIPLTGSDVLAPHANHPFEATAVGLVGHLEGASALPDGIQVATVTIHPSGSESPDDSLEIPLWVGEHFAEGDPASAQHTVPAPAGYFSPDRPQIAEYHTMLEWPELGAITPEIEISVHPGFAGTLIIRGATLLDQRMGGYMPMTLPTGVDMIHSGDVKIYEFEETLSRAHIVCSPRPARTGDELWEAVRGANVAVLDENVVNGSECPDGSTRILSYEPERIEIEAASGANAYLILSDAWYPGWTAQVDGEPEEVLRANGMFRAVRLPRGEHNVVWVYEPRSFTVGAIVSGVFLVGVTAVFVLLRPAKG